MDCASQMRILLIAVLAHTTASYSLHQSFATGIFGKMGWKIQRGNVGTANRAQAPLPFASRTTICTPLYQMNSGTTELLLHPHFPPSLQFLLLIASKAQKPGEAGGVRQGLGVGQCTGQIWSRLLKMVKSNKEKGPILAHTTLFFTIILREHLRLNSVRCS